MAPLKIIGAGYGRTGTLSLCRALDILGFSCHHMEKMILDDTQDPNLFKAAYESPDEEADWDHIFRGYDAAVDWPAAAFWERLMKQYPDAKVILTVRDPEAWYASVGKTIHDWPMNDGEWPEKMLASRRMARTIVKEGELKVYADREAMLEQFRRHVARVCEIVPRERLLVFEPSQGWEPLCSFLGVAPPLGVPYPHLNRGTLFRERLRRVRERVSAGKQGELSLDDGQSPHKAVSEIAAWEEAYQLV
ncbi:P-loop containing nucleoside triphosphate hydrolase protein [Aspergillus egyptiacus]|nr:P-loop containing nucleoside triphosphate hydrolase protein [Aspergillus egyptiacus]